MFLRILIILSAAISLGILFPGAASAQDPSLVGTILGIPPDWIGVAVALVILCERIGKLIPDDKVGTLGVIRKILKVLGAYTPNR